MARDASCADAHADGHDLLAIDPDTGEALATLAVDAECREGSHRDLLERADEVHDVALTGEPDQRVDDQLTGTVVGDVAATVHRDDIDAGALEIACVEQHVRLARTTPKRVDGWMLEQQHGVRDVAGLTVGDETLLEGPRTSVVGRAELDHA